MEHGLFSPARIVHAGLEALEAVPGLGEKKAVGILSAAEQWIEQHPPVEAEPEIEDITGGALPAVDDAAADQAPPESMARTSAE